MHRQLFATPLVALVALVACDPTADNEPAPDAAPAAALRQVEPEHPLTDGKKLLIIEKKGVGEGIVRGPDFECGVDCPYLEMEYDVGSQIALTAEPAPASDHFSRFTSWAVDCTGADASACSLTFDRSRKVEVTFGLDGQVAVNRLGVAGGRVTSHLADGSPGSIDCGSQCQAAFTEPTALTLSAPPVITPTGAIKLLRWGGACFGNQVDCTLNVAGSHDEVNAEFRNALTIAPTGNGAATFKVVKPNDAYPDEYVIDCGADCEGLYTATDEVTVIAVPAAGSDLLAWGTQCTPVPGSPLACKVKMSTPHTLTPKVMTRVDVTIKGTPVGAGTILATTSTGLSFTCAPTASAPACVFHGVVRNSTVTLKATADSTHVFEAWTGCSSSTATCQLTADVNRTVVAKFATRYQLRTRILLGPGDATMTLSSPSGTVCKNDCTTKYAAKQQVTITRFGLGPWQECWVFDGWGGACAGGATTCTVMVDDLKNATTRWKRLSACSPPHH
jgi:hypothetical protein